MSNLTYEDNERKIKEINEKESTLDELRSSNEKSLVEIKKLYKEISEANQKIICQLDDYTMYESVLEELDNLQPLLKIDDETLKKEKDCNGDTLINSLSNESGLKSNASDSNSLTEQKIILAGRDAMTNKLFASNNKYGKQVKDLEDRLSELYILEADLKNKINCILYQTKQFEIVEKCSGEEISKLTIIENQRNINVVARLEKTLNDINGALINTKNKICSVELDHSKTLLKDIKTLQSQIIHIESEISSVRKSLLFVDNYSMELDEIAKRDRENQASKANWEKERNFLKETIASLKKEVNSLEGERIKHKEGRSGDTQKMSIYEAVSPQEKDKYRIFAKLWGGKIPDSYTPNMSELDSLYEKAMEPRRKLAEMIKENKQKQERIRVLKRKLDLAIKRFRDEDRLIDMNIAKNTQEFQEKEGQILSKIKETKIAIAQRMIDQGIYNLGNQSTSKLSDGCGR